MDSAIGCDMHKRYSVFVAINDAGQTSRPVRVEHERTQLREYLAGVPRDTPVAFETTGHWYWFADLLEAAGLKPQLTNARKATVMMGHTNKTDRLDAQGLAVLLHTGTLPAVWIAPRTLRDERELLRWRRAFVRQRTSLENRVHATLAKYAIRIDEVSDLVGKTRTYYGRVRKDVNHSLKWAYAEAANAVVRTQRSRRGSHVDALYARLKRGKGPATAVVAVARHLAEATYWMWIKAEPYRDPKLHAQETVSSTPGQAQVTS